MGCYSNIIVQNHMTVPENITAIEQKIAAVARSCGRDPAAVRLIAVSKQQPQERLKQALDAGQRLFGENRVQEAKTHWEGLGEQYPGLELHLIGSLQTNKARDAVRLFDMIQTLDRPKLARALAAEMKKQNRFIPCLIEVNTGAESQKSGVLPEDLAALLAIAREECGLDIRGLMCIPPVNELPAPHFGRLRDLAQQYGLKELSMGMSGDFEQAIPPGATYVRIGTALFGARDGGAAPIPPAASG